MSIVIADPILRRCLEQLSTGTEIRDSTGKVLGFFTPCKPDEEEAVYAKLKQHFDPVKTERIFAEEHGKGRPLAEIPRDLEAREAQR